MHWKNFDMEERVMKKDKGYLYLCVAVFPGGEDTAGADRIYMLFFHA